MPALNTALLDGEEPDHGEGGGGGEDGGPLGAAMTLVEEVDLWATNTEVREAKARGVREVLAGTQTDLTARATVLSVLQQAASSSEAGATFVGAVVADCEAAAPNLRMLEWALSGLDKHFVFAKKHASESWLHITVAAIRCFHDPVMLLGIVLNDLLLGRHMISRTAGVPTDADEASSPSAHADPTSSSKTGNGHGNARRKGSGKGSSSGSNIHNSNSNSNTGSPSGSNGNPGSNASTISQLRFVRVMDALTEIAASVSGLYQLRLHFPTLVNAIVGLCASYPVPGKESADLLCAASDFLLREDFLVDWAAQQPVYSQMFFALDHDMAGACQRTDFSTRTTGVLTAWLTVYLALSRLGSPVEADTQLDTWASHATYFGQLLFAQADWAAIDLLGVVCANWIKLLTSFQAICRPGQYTWSRLISVLSCALRRPSPKVVTAILPMLGEAAARQTAAREIESDDVPNQSTALEQPGSALFELMSRGNVSEDSLRSFYERAFAHVSLDDHVRQVILAARDPPSCAWARFVVRNGLRLAHRQKAATRAETLLCAPSPKAMCETLRALHDTPDLQADWLNLVLTSASKEHGSASAQCLGLIEVAARFALRRRRRRLLVTALKAAAPNSLSPALSRACTLGNPEDAALRTLAAAKTADKTLILALVDAGDVGVQAAAMQRIARLEFTLQEPLLARAHKLLESAWTASESGHAGFERVDDFLQQASTMGFDFAAQKLYLESNVAAIAHARRARVAATFADQLVDRKLRTFAGPAGQTLSLLDHVLHAMQNADAPTAPMNAADAVAFLDLTRTLVFRLERAILLAADAGARLRTQDAKAKSSPGVSNEPGHGEPASDIGYPALGGQAAASRRASKFFDKNRAVCQDWFRNTRKRLLDARQTKQHLDTDTVWHAWQSLRDPSWNEELDLAMLRELGQCLVYRCECPDVLRELIKWAPEQAPADAWKQTIEAAALHAGEAYEDAARLYSSVARDLLAADRSRLGDWDSAFEALRWSVQGTLDCLVATGDTEGVSQWSAFLTKEQERAWEAKHETLADALTGSASALHLGGQLGTLSAAGCGAVGCLVDPLQAVSASHFESDSGAFADYWMSRALVRQAGLEDSASHGEGFDTVFHGLEQADRALRKDLAVGFLSNADTLCLSRLQSHLWAVRACGLASDVEALELTRMADIPSLSAMWWPLRLAPSQSRGDALLIAARKARETGNPKSALRLMSAFKENEVRDEVMSSQTILRAFLAAPEPSGVNDMMTRLQPAEAHMAHMELSRLETEAETRKVHLWHACETAAALSDADTKGMCWYEYGALCEAEGEMENAVSAFAKFVRWSSSVHEHAGRRTAACLRLLGMLPQLEEAVTSDDVRAELAMTPTLAWTQLIPQILAGAARPSELLQALALRIARAHPGRITWSVIAAREQLGEDLFRQLRAQIPAFAGAESIVAELVGCAIWLEERWHALIRRVLAQKRKTLEAIRSIQSNVYFDEATKRKSCRDVMQPSISNLRDHFEATLGGALEPHETDDSEPAQSAQPQGFQASRPTARSHELRENIGRAINLLDNFEIYGIETAWDALEVEEHKLATWLRMRQGDASLQEFAPGLFRSDVLQGEYTLRVPGQWDVGVHSFENRVQALTSKTRPKRVWIRGTDGRPYGFLLKGGDDMRLDERVLQIGSILDSLLPEAGSIRTYEVVALGQSVGLVQWVEGARPIMDVYESRCLSEGTRALKGDAFVSAIHRRLAKESNISLEAAREIRRTDWPEAIIIDALRELVCLVPKDLLARELWTCSPDASAWWARSKRYARSLAGSSIFGHIMGLGDRHVSNIMLDLSSGPGSGELVHIDYNVCFESGHRLAVPETVPFRLTRSLQGALPLQRAVRNEDGSSAALDAPGWCGKEGIYAGWARVALTCMREHRKLILSLVGSIVNDSSISWTGSKMKVADNSLNVNVSISLLASEVNIPDEADDDESLRVDALLALEEEAKAAAEAVPRPVLPQHAVQDDKISHRYRPGSRQESAHHEIVNEPEQMSSIDRQRLGAVLGGLDPGNGDAIDDEERQDPRAALEQLEGDLEELRGNLRLRREWLTEALQSIIQVQGRCDRMQAQLASGSIALQQGHVLPRIDASLTQAFAMLDVRRDASAGKLKTVAEEAMRSLESLQSDLKQHGEADGYGSNTLVDDWVSRFQTMRMGVYEILDMALAVIETDRLSAKEMERLASNVERAEEGIRNTVAGVEADHIRSTVASVAQTCVDPSVAWRHAFALDWFWNAGIGAFDRSAAALSAVKARLELRRQLARLEKELASSIEAFRRAGAQTDTSRRAVLESAEALSRVLSSVAKIEAQALDVRVPATTMIAADSSESGAPGAAAAAAAVGAGGRLDEPMALHSWESMSMDTEFGPLAEEAAKEVEELARGIREGLALARRIRALREAAREVDDAEAAHRRFREKKVAEAERARAALNDKIEVLRNSALLGNAQVWANISNIRRGADQEGPFFELASDLIAQRTLSSQADIKLARLVQCTQRIRDRLRKLLALARKGTGDFGRRPPDEETQRKRRQVKAAEVLRRVDAKLSDAEPVASLVATLTSQATSEKRLARMYEGWMPFV
ncbi:Serine/threonine-protein kinase SMG1 [Hondaea fermentalgiana]|uniref:non-specific serine/threonine protein kinase n=1 Tax=Hondaea fermentalgiana TaxID=2315210 RepID=A0A2R5GAK3_9STRA|nr:Serine/threonine-protein kinase SMG1 [Hondaea fermentalgiana]|eukprot:GBG28042.1 Serine/threonine-protein kinase SMG1 [Hondaea fermentalgiana]